MRMMPILVVAGLCSASSAGLVSYYFTRGAQAKAAPYPAPTAGQEADDTPSPVMPAMREAPVVQVENAAPSIAEAPTDKPNESPAAREPTVQDPVEARKRVFAEEQTFLDEHRREPRDNAWAASKENQISGKLFQLANRHGFYMGAVVCKTTRCTAEVRFDNRERGRATFPRILHGMTETRCGVAIVLPEKGNEGLTTNVRFDCEEARADELSAG